MAITAADLIAPTGELASGLLAAIAGARVPALTEDATGVTTVATGLASVANDKVANDAAWDDATTAEQDDGAEAWAYYLAYHERASQIVAGFTSASGANEGSVSYSVEQAKQLEALATSWKATYEGLVPAVVVDTPLPPTSRVMPVTFVW